jgi:hypothetical protein
MPVLVDSNVLVYFWDATSVFHQWAEAAIQEEGENDILAVNPIIYAELCLAVESAAALDRRLKEAAFERLDLPWSCLFSAAQAFGKHVKARKVAARKPGKTPLPDFFIGAHAEAMEYSVLTVGAARFRTCFPKVRVVAPD